MRSSKFFYELLLPWKRKLPLIQVVKYFLFSGLKLCADALL